MDDKTLAQEVVLLVKQMCRNRQDMYDVLDTVKCAVRKYDVTLDEVSLRIADVDCKKLIWQILIDLRFARGTDYYFDIELYRSDTEALHEITSFLEKNTTEFNREGSTVADISSLDRKTYLELIQKYGLK